MFAILRSFFTSRKELKNVISLFNHRKHESNGPTDNRFEGRTLSGTSFEASVFAKVSPRTSTDVSQILSFLALFASQEKIVHPISVGCCLWSRGRGGSPVGFLPTGHHKGMIPFTVSGRNNPGKPVRLVPEGILLDNCGQSHMKPRRWPCNYVPHIFQCYHSCTRLIKTALSWLA